LPAVWRKGDDIYEVIGQTKQVSCFRMTSTVAVLNRGKKTV